MSELRNQEALEREAHCRFGSGQRDDDVSGRNAGARAAYARLGFREAGVRPGYYPAAHGKRESAVLMSLGVDPGPGDDALE